MPPRLRVSDKSNLLISQNTFILKALLKAKPEPVSGTALAKGLGTSRASVWRRIAQLRQQGFKIEALPRRGYHLVKKPKKIHPDLIVAYLEGTSAPPKLFFHPQVDSTNSAAERLLGTSQKTPFIVLASSQIQGRGRRGRRWHSTSEGNLYMSFGFSPRLAPQKVQTFTLWMGARICDFFNTHHTIPLRVKWPNDLFYKRRKVAGMLTESRIDSGRVGSLIFGLGLNVNHDPGTTASELAGVTTSLAKIIGKQLPINRIAAALIDEVLKAYHEFVKGISSKSLEQLWSRYDYLSGQNVTVQNGEQSLKGTIGGINKNGALRIHLENGRETVIHTGDISIAY